MVMFPCGCVLGVLRALGVTGWTGVGAGRETLGVVCVIVPGRATCVCGCARWGLRAGSTARGRFKLGELVTGCLAGLFGRTVSPPVAGDCCGRWVMPEFGRPASLLETDGVFAGDEKAGELAPVVGRRIVAVVSLFGCNLGAILLPGLPGRTVIVSPPGRVDTEPPPTDELGFTFGRTAASCEIRERERKISAERSGSGRTGAGVPNTGASLREAICGRAVSPRTIGVVPGREPLSPGSLLLPGRTAGEVDETGGRSSRLGMIFPATLGESPAGRATWFRLRATASSCARTSVGEGRCGR